MFLRILKKDLKRKKTMNIILLLFVILSSMFASASVNNINAVTGGIDRYFELAEVPDLITYLSPDCEAENEIRALPSVKEIEKTELIMTFSSKQFYCHGKQLDNFINPASFYTVEGYGIRVFDADDKEISSVGQGSFYATLPFSTNTDIKPGDTVTLKVGETEMDLKYLGVMKSAIESNESTSGPALLFHQKEYDILRDEPEIVHNGTALKIWTDDIDAVQQIAKKYPADVSVMEKDDYKALYLYDMLAAYILMTISILLMLTAFVVLRFSIGFTISEEYREIGVMKAVGIDNRSIRGLYIAKYLAISVIGSVIGFFCSVPLASAMMKTVSKNMVLRGRHTTAYGIISSAAVIAIIMLFCYTCTRRVRKLSPIDAVRSGQTGERFRKKSLMHLGRSKLPSTGFLAVNDVLSAPKRFCIISVVFAVCLLLVTCMSNFVMTLKSDKIHMHFDIPVSELHILDSEIFLPMLKDASNTQSVIDNVENILSENGIPGSCTTELENPFEAWHGDQKAAILFCVLKGKTDYVFPMEEGSAPQKTDEVCVTSSVLTKLNVQIGDRIKARINGEEYEFIITGRYSSFMSPGIRLHPDFDLGHAEMSGTTGIAIHFDKVPDKKGIERNKEILKKELGTDKVYTTSGIIQEVTGMTETMETIKQMMLILTAVVTILIVVLMERSFISKERSEIALMKAVGISNGSIIAQHTLRFGIAAVIACFLSAAALFPLSSALFSFVCSMIGDVSKIAVDYDAVEVFVIYPLLLIGAAVIGTFFTALYTRSIKASDTASIE